MMNEMDQNDPCPCGSGKKYKKCCQKFNSEAALEKALDLILQGNLKEAEELLSRALNEFDNVVVRNNLATVFLERNEITRCLEILHPYLDPENESSMANPYTLAIASRAFALSGKQEEAYRYLQEAEDMFESVLRNLSEGQFDENEIRAWKEYTLIIMKAAAELEDHQRVQELYRRWNKEHVSWENIILAAIANFNLKQYGKSAYLFGEMTKEWSIGYQFQQVALLAEQEAIPPFIISYKLNNWERMLEMLNSKDGEDAFIAEAKEDTSWLLILLSAAFHPEMEEESSAEFVQKMVCRLEAWGEDFGKRLLKSLDISISVKVAAAKGLMEKGVFQPGDPVPMLIEGEERKVTLEEIPVIIEADQETLEALQKARDLEEDGLLEEAVGILEEIYHNRSFYPPVVIALSSLLHQLDRLTEAESYMRMVEGILYEDPVVLFNLSLILFEQGRIQEAKHYLNKLDGKQVLDKEISERVDMLKKHMAETNLEDPSSRGRGMSAFYEEEQRQKIEEKFLSTCPSLSRCLKNMPADWLTGLCSSLKLEPARRRREREQQLEEALLKKSNLRLLLKENVDDTEHYLLRYILEEGGFARFSTVTQKFGSMEGDGFFWKNALPESPLGVLWALALAVVGKANVGKRYEKIVTVPQELRQPLAKLLGMKTNIAEPKTIGEYQQDEASSPGQEDKVLVFRVNLTDRYARVQGYPYRVLAVYKDCSLYELAQAIIESFGFSFDHSFGFYDNIKKWTHSIEGYEYFADIGEANGFPGVKDTQLWKVFPERGKKMLFLFDYGDKKRFLVRLQKEIEKDERNEYPKVLKSKGEI